MESIVIIGNGIAGTTAARHIRKCATPQAKKITIISSETYYFFSRTALMYVYMGHMKFDHLKPYEDAFWEKNQIKLIKDFVTKVDTKNKNLLLEKGDSVKYDTLLLATGSKPNMFGWPGQTLKGVQGLVSKQDLDNLETYAPDNITCKRAVVVGGGLIGIELCEMLRSRDIPVTFLVREQSFWNGVLPSGDSAMINEHILEHHIDLRLGLNLGEILEGKDGHVRAVTIKETGEEIPCEFVGITAGVTPNIDFLKGSGIELGKGIKVNRYLETNVPDIYAIGDCAEQREPIGQRKAVEAVWYTSRMMGETVAQTLCGNKVPYNPGHWFNSAKFLDIEYQTYGWVFSERLKKENEQHFHWRHDREKVCITIACDKVTRRFFGINALGIRLRHELFDRWLTENRTVDYIIEHLKDANFDPECYASYESDIIEKYNMEFGTDLRPKKKSWKRILQPRS